MRRRRPASAFVPCAVGCWSGCEGGWGPDGDNECGAVAVWRQGVGAGQGAHFGAGLFASSSRDCALGREILHPRAGYRRSCQEVAEQLWGVLRSKLAAINALNWAGLGLGSLVIMDGTGGITNLWNGSRAKCRTGQ